MIEDCGLTAGSAGGVEDGPKQGRPATSPRPFSATPATAAAPGSKWTDGQRVYVIDDRLSRWADVGLIPALLRGEAVHVREADLGVRLHPTEDR